MVSGRVARPERSHGSACMRDCGTVKGKIGENEGRVPEGVWGQGLCPDNQKQILLYRTEFPGIKFGLNIEQAWEQHHINTKLNALPTCVWLHPKIPTNPYPHPGSAIAVAPMASLMDIVLSGYTCIVKRDLSIRAMLQIDGTHGEVVSN
ncbi:uncharacterized protein EI90DRAFT_3020265 [Cantharellus anzutake]|uniref:uncharacterized protein n=1 Tax=Cantharellus anzutake TaxID=1750568 RepID=UPI0019030F79|nr:uncharacterized protein EI90DRAFT_3020265 [Cantharellus anzutake]KAF8321486.1 hypothetical protein EI90DRAFT_3020265 [Cantharellus anzutake]